jgi:S1-C subfamily serine protease
VVVELDGKDILSSAQLRNAVGLKRVGDRIVVTVLREGKRKEFKAELTATAASAVVVASDNVNSEVLKGVTLRDADQGQGVLVTEVKNDAEAAGKLIQGDLIVSVNQRRVADVKQFSDVLEASKGRLLLRVLRGQMALWIVLQP